MGLIAGTRRRGPVSLTGTLRRSDARTMIEAQGWATGEDDGPPADHYGGGAYLPRPGNHRCYREAAGHSLLGHSSSIDGDKLVSRLLPAAAG